MKYGIYADYKPKPAPESNTIYYGAHALNCQCDKCRIKRGKK